jgi:pyruvate kinase
MLSAETSVGAHPAHTVATMACIVTEAENASADAATTSAKGVETDACPDPRTGDAIAAAASEVGKHIGAVALCCFTRTGDTARRLARQRSPLPLLAFAHDESQRSRLALSWGVEAAVLAPATTADSLPREVSRALLETGRYQAGDLVVVVSGSQGGVPGSTDSLRVLRVD